jgi:hypothetical protein
MTFVRRRQMRYEGDLQELPRQMIKLFLQHLQLSALIYYFVREYTDIEDHRYIYIHTYIYYFVL